MDNPSETAMINGYSIFLIYLLLSDYVVETEYLCSGKISLDEL